MANQYFKTGVALGVLLASGVVRAESCGDVTIANMNWQSAEVMANVDKIILNQGYGCNADLVTGDTVPTITSMAEKGRPDIVPEGWIDLVPDVAKAGLDSGKLVQAAKSLTDGGAQGWWIPKYFADAHPDIKTFSDVLRHPELFPAPEDPKKGAVYNGPQGWGGTVVTSQLFKAYNFDKHGFVLVDTGSAAGLDGSIAQAYERKAPWLGYYWAPTALLGKYPMVKLQTEVPNDAAEWKRCNTVADCPDPKPNAWPVDRVYTLTTPGFAKRSPVVMEYLSKRAWSNTTANSLIAWMTDNQATGEEGAKYFLKNNEALWSQWVTPQAQAKIKASL
ncbi:MAG: ABC transporter substrate-binding protein [Pseudomonas sp.]|uniref:ABC transporter substrate-binding protein n=1 Tax=Pseudomonas abieticivorans TaxID=2931382 RepID=UPI0020BE66BF|nr:ABC transporter substrate-binding protein [Pseudomonas sp. PIA16]MDE1169408.1 ABC transporter substrate-binding protein [Pseudomonas sp.]